MPEPPWVEPAVTVASGTDRAMLTMILDVLELAHRRLVIAKAERVDTTQLELEFAISAHTSSRSSRSPKRNTSG